MALQVGLDLVARADAPRTADRRVAPPDGGQRLEFVSELHDREAKAVNDELADYKTCRLLHFDALTPIYEARTRLDAATKVS